MKKGLLFASVFFVVTTTAFSMPAKPKACPPAELIRALSVTTASKAPDGKFYGFNFNNYNLDEMWVFVIGPLQATNPEEAKEEASRRVGELSGQPTPEPFDPDNDIPSRSLKNSYQYSTWGCTYAVNDIKAVTFVLDTMMQFSIIKKQLSI